MGINKISHIFHGGLFTTPETITVDGLQVGGSRLGMLLAAGLVSLALAPPQVLTGVEARRACSSAGKLCAQAILAAKEPTETAILANALSRDLSDRLSGNAALVTVEDDEDGLADSHTSGVAFQEDIRPLQTDVPGLGGGAIGEQA